jgi:hypothetical protein
VAPGSPFLDSSGDGDRRRRLAGSCASLHQAAIRAAEIRAGLLADGQAAHGLEQQLIHALVDCLSAGPLGEDISAHRHRDILARFGDLLQMQPFLRVTEICAVLGVSDRILRSLCEEHLGVSPSSYLSPPTDATGTPRAAERKSGHGKRRGGRAALRKDCQPDRWVFFRNDSFDTKNPLDDGVPMIRRMTEEELKEFKGRKEPRPNVEKENATDAEAVAQLSSDVRRFLHMIDRPTLIRDFANLMIRSDGAVWRLHRLLPLPRHRRGREAR